MTQPWKWAIGIFLFTFLVHSLIALSLFPTNIAAIYQLAARQYLDHTFASERIVDFSPLYLYVHIAAHALVHNPNRLILWTQFALSAGAAVFLFFILQRFFPLPLALLGTVAFIFNRSVIVYVSAFVPEPLMIIGVLGFVWYAMCPDWRSSLGAGICLTVSLLTRSNLFPLVLLAPACFWLNRPAGKPFWRRVIIFELPVMAALVFLILRNTLMIGTLTPFAMNPGTVFFEGNNPNSYGESSVYPPIINDLKHDFPDDPDVQHSNYRLVARRVTGQPLTIAEVNAYWMRKATNFLVDHPGHAFRLLATKCYALWHNYRRHDLASIHWNDQRLPRFLTIPFAVIAALALPGLVFALRAWKQRLVLYLVCAAQMSVMLTTYVSDRQRVAIMGILIVFACETLHTVWLQKRMRWIVPLVLALIPCLAVSTDVIKDDLHTWRRYDQSGALMEQARSARQAGFQTRAAEQNALALALTPGQIEQIRLAEVQFAPQSFTKQAYRLALTFPDRSAPARFDLARLALLAGYPDEAETLLQELLADQYRFNRQYRQSSQVEFYLARVSEQRRDFPKAITFLQQALCKAPGDPWALSHLLALTNEDIYRMKLFRYFDEIDAQFFAGQAYLELHQPQAAVESLTYVVERLPEFRKGLLYYSLALGAAGDVAQAAEYYLKALKKGREPIFNEDAVLAFFHQWAQLSPSSPEPQYYLAVILREFGHYEEALTIQLDLLAQYPDREEIQKNVMALEKLIAAD